MKRLISFFAVVMCLLTAQAGGYPYVTDKQQNGDFPLVADGMAATIVVDERDYAVVGITAEMLADDVERVTTLRPRLIKCNSRKMPKGKGAVVVAGTIGKSKLIDELIRKRYIHAEEIKGKWESFIMTTVNHPTLNQPVLVIAGSDRRGTAFGLTSMSEAIGVSPWYWWADVNPQQKRALFVQSGTFRQDEPSVQYRGIFINDAYPPNCPRRIRSELHLRKGTNRIAITDVKPDARIDQIFIGLWPPFTQEPRLRINASNYYLVHDSREGSITTIQGLGFHDGVLVQPFNTPSYDVANLSVAPFVSYKLNLSAGDKCIEIRALPTLHVYEGRDVRYAVQLGNEKPVVFSIHADDFCAEWRWNVLRGYSSRSIPIPADLRGSQELKVYFLDPGVVLQEIAVQ